MVNQKSLTELLKLMSKPPKNGNSSDCESFIEEEFVNIFPQDVNVEELRRINELNISLQDVGYDRLVEKYLKRIISKRIFYFGDDVR